MKRLIVSHEAKTDLGQIRRYSRDTWNAGQAQRYMEKIILRFAWLMRNASHGSRQDSILPGLRRVNAGRHAIFYVERDDAVVVVRVLHQSMDHHGKFRPTP